MGAGSLTLEWAACRAIGVLPASGHREERLTVSWRNGNSGLTRLPVISCAMQLRHRNPQAGRPYVRSDKYQLVSRAVLELLPPSGEGHATEELVAALAHVLPPSLFPTFASIRWFLTAVRIDLEARGQIQRVGRRKPARYIAGPATLPGSPPTLSSIVIPDWTAADHVEFPRRRAV